MHPHNEISLLVPFRADNAPREELWDWLARYWRHELPNCEIVIGRDRTSSGRHRHKIPFSKTVAVNDAFAHAHGDIIVILDADTYIPGHVVSHAAERLRRARTIGLKEWFVPYRQIYRLTEATTRAVLDSDPCQPMRFPTPPDPLDVEDTSGSAWGHKYGALIQVMPREAFERVGGMDCRFRGWGGEDVAFLLALDALWGRHKNTAGDVLHLWHPKLHHGHWTDSHGATWETRIWQGQKACRKKHWQWWK